VAGFVGTPRIISAISRRGSIIMRLTMPGCAARGHVRDLWPPSGPGVSNIIVHPPAVYWTRYARIIRGEVLSVRRDFVRLAVVAGCSKWTIMRRHILPSVKLRDRAGHPQLARRSSPRRRSRSWAWACRRPTRWVDAGARQEGLMGLLVADRAAGLLHHADGSLGEPPGRLAPRQVRSTLRQL